MTNVSIFSAIFLVLTFFNLPPEVRAASVNIHAIVNTNCGDSIKDPSEACDGTDLGGASCTSIGLGFTGGTLSCTASCNYNTSACTSPTPPPPPAGGGGGGAGGILGIPPTGAVFSGRAYPNSPVVLLKDGEIVASTTASVDARFQISMAGLTGGNYLFSLYAIDRVGNRSSLVSLPIRILSGTTVGASGVFITPTIRADKLEVKKGEPVILSGQTFPQSAVTISLLPPESYLGIEAGRDGGYVYKIDTAGLVLGEHLAKSKAEAEGDASAYGRSAAFTVGDENIPAPPPIAAVSRADLNTDGKVNLVDFSILAYWIKRSNPPERFDLNKDKSVNLVDFSILAYYWSG